MPYNMLKSIVVTFTALLISFITIGQSLQSLEPPSKKWQQINTDTLRLIYPATLDSQAQRIAGMIHHIYKNNYQSIGSKRWKINMILHDESQVSNAFVSPLPFHSELFINAPMQSHKYVGSGNWGDLITIHEYRHVLQFMNSRKGISGISQYLFGNYGLALSTGIFIPNWFMEGDAVVTETALSPAGRGRSPAFTAQLRALLLENKSYKYVKWKNRSYKDVIPNHYVLGYVMSNYARNQYGNNIWSGVFTDAVKLKYPFYPLSWSLRVKTGEGSKKLQQSSFADLKKRYASYLDSIGLSHTHLLKTSKNPKYPEFYKHPLSGPNGSIICVKSSYNDIDALISIDSNGAETKLCYLGNTQPGDYISCNQEKVIWAEYLSNSIWGHQSYFNVVEYDFSTGRKRFLTNGINYKSPAIRADGKQIICVSVNKSGEYFLVWLDASGAELKRIKSPYLPHYPQWGPQGSIIFTASANNHNFICRYNPENNSFEALCPKTVASIGIPHVYGKSIYFSASFNGMDNIYVLHTENGNIDQLTSVSVAAYEPAVIGDKLVFSELRDSKGNSLSYIYVNNKPYQTNLKVTEYFPENIEKQLFGLKAIENEGGSICEANYPKRFSSSKYRKAFHLIKPVGYAFYALNEEINSHILFADYLNYSSLTVNHAYNYRHQTQRWNVQASYQGIFPFINAYVSQYLNGSHPYYNSKNDLKTSSWSESVAGVGISASYDISKNEFNRILQADIKYNFHKTDLQLNNDPVQNFSFNDISFKARYSNTRFLAYKQFYPRFGQQSVAIFNKGLDKNISQLYFHNRIYLPGLYRTHSFRADIDFQFVNTDNSYYYFYDNFIYARTYDIPAYKRIYKVALNYSFPVFYPDFGIHGIFYFNRIRSNLFFDFSNTTGETTAQMHTYNSTGIELNFDVIIFDYIPISIGFGLAYRINNNVDGTAPGFNFFQVIE